MSKKILKIMYFINTKSLNYVISLFFNSDSKHEKSVKFNKTAK